MMAAARTAPKGRGIDNLEIAVYSGEELGAIAARMREYSELPGKKTFARDAASIESSEAVVFVGTRIKPVGLNCAICGFPTCAEKPSAVPCGFNLSDVGIALGSAASIAADKRIDCRIMYTAGVAVKAMGYFPDCHVVYALPLSCTGKSPFFDRPAVH